MTTARTGSGMTIAAFPDRDDGTDTRCGRAGRRIGKARAVLRDAHG